jgi:hypothetical protein
MWPVGNDAGSVRASGGLNPVPHLASPRQGGVLLKKTGKEGDDIHKFPCDSKYRC